MSAYDPAIIENFKMENSNDGARYYVHCTAFLDEFLESHPTLEDRELRRQVTKLLEWLAAKPEDRNSSCANDIAIDLHLFGMIGKALYFLRGKVSGQFERELGRLFESIDSLRGNLWLFYIAGQLAQDGFKIEFIRETEEKTPDMKASNDTKGLILHIEATTRSQKYDKIEDISKLIWDLFNEKGAKPHKFKRPEYDPGMVVVDISHLDLDANQSGEIPRLCLKRNLIVNYGSSYVYDTAKDPDFFDRPENKGNIIRYAIDYFKMLNTDKYCVRALLLGFSMMIVERSGQVEAPKGAVLIVDSRYKQLAIPALAPAIYLIDVSRDTGV